MIMFLLHTKIMIYWKRKIAFVVSIVHCLTFVYSNIANYCFYLSICLFMMIYSPICNNSLIYYLKFINFFNKKINK